MWLFKRKSVLEKVTQEYLSITTELKNRIASIPSTESEREEHFDRVKMLEFDLGSFGISYTSQFLEFFTDERVEESCLLLKKAADYLNLTAGTPHNCYLRGENRVGWFRERVIAGKELYSLRQTLEAQFSKR